MEQVGPTGKFPKGKLNKDDEGELQIAVGVDRKEKKVLINFGKPVSWAGLDPDGARDLATVLNQKADAAEGKQ